MVKLTGPGLGARASGKLADALIYSSNKGRAYVKKFARPKQPRSAPQVSMRATMKFLSEEWSGLIPIKQATWLPTATRNQITPFNAFQAYNLNRARNNQRPTETFPAADLGGHVHAGSFLVTGGVRKLTISLNVTDPDQAWGMVYSHVAANLDVPTWDQHVKLHKIPGVGPMAWTWTPLIAGTYWIHFSHFTITGNYDVTAIWLDAVVTN